MKAPVTLLGERPPWEDFHWFPRYKNMTLVSAALRWSDGVVICNFVWWVALCVHCRAVCFVFRRTVYSNDLFA